MARVYMRAATGLCLVESAFRPPQRRGHDVDEIIFVVEEAPEGGYSARALGASIFTEADDLEALQTEVRDAVLCHYDDEAARAACNLTFGGC